MYKEICYFQSNNFTHMIIICNLDDLKRRVSGVIYDLGRKYLISVRFYSFENQLCVRLRFYDFHEGNLVREEVIQSNITSEFLNDFIPNFNKEFLYKRS